MGFQRWHAESASKGKILPARSAVIDSNIFSKATRQTSPSDERKSSIATLTQDMVTSTTDEDEDGEDDDDGITHQILPRAAVAMLPPIMVRLFFMEIHVSLTLP